MDENQGNKIPRLKNEIDEFEHEEHEAILLTQICKKKNVVVV